MHTVHAAAAFADLTEEEVERALDFWDAVCENGETKQDAAPVAPPDGKGHDHWAVIHELERLVDAYVRRFEELCREGGCVPETALTHVPSLPVEAAAFDIFAEALHDSLQDADEDD